MKVKKKIDFWTLEDIRYKKNFAHRAATLTFPVAMIEKLSTDSWGAMLLALKCKQPVSGQFYRSWLSLKLKLYWLLYLSASSFLLWQGRGTTDQHVREEFAIESIYFRYRSTPRQPARVLNKSHDWKSKMYSSPMRCYCTRELCQCMNSQG